MSYALGSVNALKSSLFAAKKHSERGSVDGLFRP